MSRLFDAFRNRRFLRGADAIRPGWAIIPESLARWQVYQQDLLGRLMP
jgi:hypothetical protein